MWPGFGDNVRVLDWVLKRIDGEDVAIESPVGYLPTQESFHLEGLSNINWEGLFSTPKNFWSEEVMLERLIILIMSSRIEI
jgi:phosphoenolpyruvate carboxykinase (GTP)